MKLYQPNKIRGNWIYDNNKYGYNYDDIPYPEILDDLKILLSELITSELLIPKKIQGIEEELKFNSADDIINLIIESGLLKRTYEFDISGDTIIFTDGGREVHNGIFSLKGFRTFQQSFTLSAYSDVWLPMAFDEDNFVFVWNLERYNFNHSRLVSLLNRLNHNLKWSNDSMEHIEQTERGAIRIGYDFFLSEDVIKQEFELNPNNNFDLNEYISRISK